MRLERKTDTQTTNYILTHFLNYLFKPKLSEKDTNTIEFKVGSEFGYLPEEDSELQSLITLFLSEYLTEGSLGKYFYYHFNRVLEEKIKDYTLIKSNINASIILFIFQKEIVDYNKEIGSLLTGKTYLNLVNDWLKDLIDREHTIYLNSLGVKKRLFFSKEFNPTDNSVQVQALVKN